MPELPEVETVRTGLEQRLLGARITRALLHRADIRTPITPGFAKQVTGGRILAVRRRAKYLLIDLDNGKTILAHLGMSGRMIVLEGPIPKAGKHDHAQFAFDNGRALIFNDARRFGVLEVRPTDEVEAHASLASLGPEPFGPAFNARYLAKMLAARSIPVKVALMDQTLVVGVGNIYASEALFRAKLSPLVKAKDAVSHAAKLVTAIRTVLKEAIASGGSTLRDYVRSSGDAGYFQHSFRVYGRDGKPCTVCGTSISFLRQAGRSTYYCARCQKETSTKKPHASTSEN